MTDIYNDVKDIIVELLGIEEEKISSTSNFRDDLDADSLDIVELIMAFEDKFGSEISDEAAQTISTVGEAVSLIEKQMG